MIAKSFSLTSYHRDYAVIKDRYILKCGTWDLCGTDGNPVQKLGDGLPANSSIH